MAVEAARLPAFFQPPLPPINYQPEQQFDPFEAASATAQGSAMQHPPAFFPPPPPPPSDMLTDENGNPLISAPPWITEAYSMVAPNPRAGKLVRMLERPRIPHFPEKDREGEEWKSWAARELNVRRVEVLKAIARDQATGRPSLPLQHFEYVNQMLEGGAETGATGGASNPVAANGPASPPQQTHHQRKRRVSDDSNRKARHHPKANSNPSNASHRRHRGPLNPVRAPAPPSGSNGMMPRSESAPPYSAQDHHNMYGLPQSDWSMPQDGQFAQMDYYGGVAQPFAPLSNPSDNFGGIDNAPPPIAHYAVPTSAPEPVAQLGGNGSEHSSRQSHNKAQQKKKPPQGQGHGKKSENRESAGSGCPKKTTSKKSTPSNEVQAGIDSPQFSPSHYQLSSASPVPGPSAISVENDIALPRGSSLTTPWWAMKPSVAVPIIASPYHSEGQDAMQVLSATGSETGESNLNPVLFPDFLVEQQPGSAAGTDISDPFGGIQPQQHPEQNFVDDENDEPVFAMPRFIASRETEEQDDDDSHADDAAIPSANAFPSFVHPAEAWTQAHPVAIPAATVPEKKELPSTSELWGERRGFSDAPAHVVASMVTQPDRGWWWCSNHMEPNAKEATEVTRSNRPATAGSFSTPTQGDLETRRPHTTDGAIPISIRRILAELQDREWEARHGVVVAERQDFDYLRKRFVSATLQPIANLMATEVAIAFAQATTAAATTNTDNGITNLTDRMSGDEIETYALMLQVLGLELQVEERTHRESIEIDEAIEAQPLLEAHLRLARLVMETRIHDLLGIESSWRDRLWREQMVDYEQISLSHSEGIERLRQLELDLILKVAMDLVRHTERLLMAETNARRQLESESSTSFSIILDAFLIGLRAIQRRERSVQDQHFLLVRLEATEQASRTDIEENETIVRGSMGDLETIALGQMITDYMFRIECDIEPQARRELLDLEAQDRDALTKREMVESRLAFQRSLAAERTHLVSSESRQRDSLGRMVQAAAWRQLQSEFMTGVLIAQEATMRRALVTEAQWSGRALEDQRLRERTVAVKRTAERSQTLTSIATDLSTVIEEETKKREQYRGVEAQAFAKLLRNFRLVLLREAEMASSVQGLTRQTLLQVEQDLRHDIEAEEKTDRRAFLRKVDLAGGHFWMEVHYMALRDEIEEEEARVRTELVLQHAVALPLGAALANLPAPNEPTAFSVARRGWLSSPTFPWKSALTPGDLEVADDIEDDENIYDMSLLKHHQPPFTPTPKQSDGVTSSATSAHITGSSQRTTRAKIGGNRMTPSQKTPGKATSSPIPTPKTGSRDSPLIKNLDGKLTTEVSLQPLSREELVRRASILDDERVAHSQMRNAFTQRLELLRNATQVKVQMGQMETMLLEAWRQQLMDMEAESRSAILLKENRRWATLAHALEEQFQHAQLLVGLEAEQKAHRRALGIEETAAFMLLMETHRQSKATQLNKAWDVACEQQRQLLFVGESRIRYCIESDQQTGWDSIMDAVDAVKLANMIAQSAMVEATRRNAVTVAEGQDRITLCEQEEQGRLGLVESLENSIRATLQFEAQHIALLMQFVAVQSEEQAARLSFQTTWQSSAEEMRILMRKHLTLARQVDLFKGQVRRQQLVINAELRSRDEVRFRERMAFEQIFALFLDTLGARMNIPALWRQKKTLDYQRQRRVKAVRVIQRVYRVHLCRKKRRILVLKKAIKLIVEEEDTARWDLEQQARLERFHIERAFDTFAVVYRPSSAAIPVPLTTDLDADYSVSNSGRGSANQKATKLNKPVAPITRDKLFSFGSTSSSLASTNPFTSSVPISAAPTAPTTVAGLKPAQLLAVVAKQQTTSHPSISDVGANRTVPKPFSQPLLKQPLPQIGANPSLPSLLTALSSSSSSLPLQRDSSSGSVRAALETLAANAAATAATRASMTKPVINTPVPLNTNHSNADAPSSGVGSTGPSKPVNTAPPLPQKHQQQLVQRFIESRGGNVAEGGSAQTVLQEEVNFLEFKLAMDLVQDWIVEDKNAARPIYRNLRTGATQTISPDGWEIVQTHLGRPDWRLFLDEEGARATIATKQVRARAELFRHITDSLYALAQNIEKPIFSLR